ncbi:MbnP family protein [Hymenobacter jeollabukensis]|uniref:Copper-binding protein MbnP-like domain-containing protein n=1 Tax=Hymenobacter jeollabukensis TaxID=2025313 RepID=A0A5R8WH11_9BACT|nr:MbnP family protein [Hymenobacter jeollabukensis]TLM87351.1 hypothetical protein FDY95_26030 [Hymenobacter jeollabukensis]
MSFRTLPAALATLLLGAAIGLTACEDDDQPSTVTTGKINFEFENVVGSQALVIGDAYSTLAGEQITVSKFNYILSNFQFTKTDGTVWAEPESYHLVKQSDTNSRKFAIEGVPFDTYTKVTFTIGVDSARNMAGAQTGALAPNNDMYWGWVSGYIFLKLEGTSPQSTSNGVYSYHVGGFRKPYVSMRTVSPALPTGVASLQVTASQSPELHLKADVQRVFAGPHPVSLRQMSGTGHGADSSGVKLAINYAAGMFRIDHVHNGD